MADYEPEFLFDGPESARTTVVLAHGAGGPMDSTFMTTIAGLIGERGLRVARFEFGYMQARRRDGRRRPPSVPASLERAWRTVIAELGAEGLIVGGKSMGGRIATMIADEAGVAGVVCLGYPFHPPGRSDRLRTEHLLELRTPTLIAQGERDTFGSQDEVPGYGLSKQIEVRWVPDGNHSLTPRKSSGRTEAENLALVADWVAEFAAGLGSSGG